MNAQVSPYVLTKEQDSCETRAKPMVYGYARVIGRETEKDGQIASLRDAGVLEDRIYMDMIPAMDAEDNEYDRLVQSLKPGDVLMIPSLDMLGVSYDDVISQWQILTKVKQAHIVVLNIELLDTRMQRHEMSSTFIDDLAMQFLAYVATRERESIRQRQREGILAAKARGVRFGRPPKPIPPQFDALLDQWKHREISSRKAAQQLGVAQETFLRWARKRG